MINEQKILDYLQNDLKRPLVEVTKENWIVVKSTVQPLKELIEFVEPLHYKVRFMGSMGLCIIPNQ